MILFIDACVRKHSRTRQLAEYLLHKIPGKTVTVRPAEMVFAAADEAFLRFRDECAEKSDFSDPVFAPAKQFAAADTIVIAAPCWDLSFPSVLKTYFEQINVCGLTFSYDKNGRPVSHCNAKRLYYVMTSGGPLPVPNHGFDYIRDLASLFYGIPETALFAADMLDVWGVDTKAQLQKAKQAIDDCFRK